MLARVDSQCPHAGEGVGLLSDSLVDVLTHDIVEDLLRCQWFPIHIAPRDPHPGGVVVVIVGDAYLIPPEIRHLWFGLLFERGDHISINYVLVDLLVHNVLDPYFGGGI